MIEQTVGAGGRAERALPRILEAGIIVDSFYIPPADASEAMSNWIVKPSDLMTTLQASGNAAFRAIGFLAPIINRVATAIIALITAPMDSFYNGVWFTIKTVLLITRQAIQACGGVESQLAHDVTRQDLIVHLYKCGAFAIAFFTAPIIAVSSPSLLVAQYRYRDLIL